MSSVQVNNFSVPFSGMVLSIEELTRNVVTYLADKYKFSAEEELKEIVSMKDTIYTNASITYGKNEVAPKKKNNKKNAEEEVVVVDQAKEEKKAKAALKRAEAKAKKDAEAEALMTDEEKAVKAKKVKDAADKKA